MSLENIDGGFSELQRQWRRDVGERDGKCMTNSRGRAVVALTLTQARRFSPALKTFGKRTKKKKKKKKHLWLSCAKANMTFMRKKTTQKGKQIS